MKLPWFSRVRSEVKNESLDTVLRRIIAAHSGGLEFVNAENCVRAPTVKAIDTAISRRIAVTPVHVYQSSVKNGREAKEKLPAHPVAKLLKSPNQWQSRIDYWQDAASTLVRYGRYIAVKGAGSTGPIRYLFPVKPNEVEIRQSDSMGVSFHRNQQEWSSNKIHYVRGPARDFLRGDSPVDDIRQSIALEIAAEKFGAEFFSRGAVPFLVFTYMTGFAGFKTPEDEAKFMDDFKREFSGEKRQTALLAPRGIDLKDPIKVENDKAQFLETRKYQRTVIAGAFGVPPHLVGDLERATFNNVEQQGLDFTLNCVMPVTRAFEAAMERDLLTEQERDSGIIIRFNLDSIMQADFKSRQEGLQIQLQNNIISPNEWREHERMNPISEQDGGDRYYRSANYIPADEPQGGQNNAPAQPQDQTSV